MSDRETSRPSAVSILFRSQPRQWLVALGVAAGLVACVGAIVALIAL